MPAYHVVSLEQIPTPEDEDRSETRADWKPIRIFLGISSFGMNAYIARRAGDLLVGEHTELDTEHEEVYFVASGRATVTIGGEEIDVPAGTLLHVRDPGLTRAAHAAENETVLLALGGTPGKAFEVSQWEREWEPKVARVES